MPVIEKVSPVPHVGRLRNRVDNHAGVVRNRLLDVELVWIKEEGDAATGQSSAHVTASGACGLGLAWTPKIGAEETSWEGSGV